MCFVHCVIRICTVANDVEGDKPETMFKVLNINIRLTNNWKLYLTLFSYKTTKLASKGFMINPYNYAMFYLRQCG